MNFQFSTFTLLWIVGTVATHLAAQGSYNLTDGNTPNVIAFTNDVGSASKEGDVIVFEGALNSVGFNVPKAKFNNAEYASVRLLVQCKVFDEAPDAGDVVDVQGAFYVLHDEDSEEGLGTAYGWGFDGTENKMTWQKLTSCVDSEPIKVSQDQKRYISFLFNYTAETYQIFVGSDTNSASAAKTLSNPNLKNKTGITGVNLLGQGGLEAIASASGSPNPLSSSIGFSAYADSKGVVFVLTTSDEQSDNDIVIQAFINGEWTEVGRAPANGSGFYQIRSDSALLQAGQSYEFRVLDENCDLHTLDTPIEIGVIEMQAVTMTPEELVVTFNTKPGHRYQVITAASLDAQEWQVTAVRHADSKGGWKYGNEPFFAAGATTTIKVPVNAARGFFKIRLVH